MIVNNHTHNLQFVVFCKKMEHILNYVKKLATIDVFAMFKNDHVIINCWYAEKVNIYI